VLGPAGDDHLLPRVLQGIVRPELLDDGILEGQDSPCGRVFREAVPYGLDGRFLDVVRRVEIGLSDPEVDDVEPLRLHLLGLGVHGQRRRRFHIPCPL
jgi:hypothetical protein